MTEEILKRLDTLATKAGVLAGQAGQQAWRLAMQQVKVELATCVIWTVVFALLAVVGAVCLKKGLAIEDSYDTEDKRMFLIISGGAGLAIGVFSVIGHITYDLPTLIFNPEYRALEIIAELVKAKG